MNSHRGTRGRMRQAGKVGGHTIAGYIDGYIGRGITGVSQGERLDIMRRTQRIQSARKRGIVFSSFPGYVKATHLHKNIVGYGHDTYSALSAVWAAETFQHGQDAKIIAYQRSEVMRDFGRRR
jgi:hypothetical protein